MKIAKQLLLAGSIFIGGVPAMTHATSTTVEVYKSATCKCCAKWVDHMRAHGFTVNTHVYDIWLKEIEQKPQPKQN